MNFIEGFYLGGGLVVRRCLTRKENKKTLSHRDQMLVQQHVSIYTYEKIVTYTTLYVHIPFGNKQTKETNIGKTITS